MIYREDKMAIDSQRKKLKSKEKPSNEYEKNCKGQ